MKSKDVETFFSNIDGLGPGNVIAVGRGVV